MVDRPAEPDAGTTLAAVQVQRVMRRAVLLPVIAVALLCGLLGLEIRGLAQDYDRVVHTEQVLSEIYQARGLIVDHETALRAHLIAVDPVFLEPYRAAERDLPRVLATLEARASDNPAQLARIGELRALYGEWKLKADAAILAPPICGLPQQSGPVQELRERKGVMDNIRAVVRAMIDEERTLLLGREERTMWATRVVLISAVALALLLVVSLVLVFRRSLRSVERSYRQALRKREASEASERQARTAAEALAQAIHEESRAVEQQFRALRDELANSLRRDP